MFADVLVDVGVCVLFCSGGGFGVYSLLAVFLRWQNYLYKFGEFSDDVRFLVF